MTSSIKSSLARHETVLLLVIVLEVVLFNALGQRFLVERLGLRKLGAQQRQLAALGYEAHPYDRTRAEERMRRERRVLRRLAVFAGSFSVTLAQRVLADAGTSFGRLLAWRVVLARALSSEGRMSGWMLTALPILTLVSMFMVSPQFYFNVASDPIFIYGYTFLIALYFLGVFIIRRMIDLKV